MKKYKVVIAGTARDIEHHLPTTIKYIEAIGDAFLEYRVVVVESNSSDGTLKALKEWKKADTLSAGNLSDTSRTVRIATCRNIIINFIEKRYPSYDYMLMMDLDEVCHHPGGPEALVESIGTCWDYDEWDVMTANQIESYYDIWALRGMQCNYDCWAMVSFSNLPREEAIRRFVSSHQVNVPQDGIIKVDSAFGGMGIYRMDLITGSRYVGRQNVCGNILEICEHVPFHEQLLAKGAKIYINTRMVTR